MGDKLLGHPYLQQGGKLVWVVCTTKVFLHGICPRLLFFAHDLPVAPTKKLLTNKIRADLPTGKKRIPVERKVAKLWFCVRFAFFIFFVGTNNKQIIENLVLKCGTFLPTVLFLFFLTKPKALKDKRQLPTPLLPPSIVTAAIEDNCCCHTL